MTQKITPNFSFKTTNNILVEVFSENLPDDDFINSIEHETTNSKDKIVIGTNKLALLINHEGNIIVLGCPFCYKKELGQEEHGYPTIADEPLISIYELENCPKDLSPFVGANMWLCPSCFTPISKLFPEVV
jgi:hypothetical protein